jgi:predicted Zn-dependent peptidase
MMFKGTARRSADDVNREFDEMGANYNAYTSHETTVYYAQVLPEFLPRTVDLIGDMLRPALREDDFAMEKQVILEEIGMYDDRPQWRLHDILLETYFQQHPLGYRVLGTNETVGALSADQMRRYFSHRYSPDNITVSAAGLIDFDALVADVEKAAGAWQPTGAARRYEDPTPRPADKSLTDDKVNRYYVSAMCPAPSAQDPRRYAAKVLTDVLGDTDGSRLYWALIDPGLADEADMSFVPADQTGSYYAYASCDPKRARQVEKVLLKTLDDYVATLDESELDRAKNKLATQATLHGENPSGRMRGLGHQWVYLNQYIPLKEELDRLTAVTPNDIRGLIAAYPFQPRTIVRMGPK